MDVVFPEAQLQIQKAFYPYSCSQSSNLFSKQEIHKYVLLQTL